jgi:hypothetical protein
MILTFRLQMFAGVAAATLCLGPVTSTEATAQIFRQRATTYGFYNPYGGGYNSGYYGGRGYGYSGYGQGRYGIGRSGAYRHGTYYRGGSFRQRGAFGRSHFGRGSRHYSPYGFGRRF